MKHSLLAGKFHVAVAHFRLPKWQRDLLAGVAGDATRREPAQKYILVLAAALTNDPPTTKPTHPPSDLQIDQPAN